MSGEFQWRNLFPASPGKPVILKFTQWKKICQAMNEIQKNVVVTVLPGSGIDVVKEGNRITVSLKGSIEGHDYVSDIRYDVSSHQLQKKTVDKNGTESGWTLITGGQAVVCS